MADETSDMTVGDAVVECEALATKCEQRASKFAMMGGFPFQDASEDQSRHARAIRVVLDALAASGKDTEGEPVSAEVLEAMDATPPCAGCGDAIGEVEFYDAGDEPICWRCEMRLLEGTIEEMRAAAASLARTQGEG